MRRSTSIRAALLLVFAIAAGIVLNHAAPELTPFAAVALVVVAVGQAILERLPKPRRHSDFKFELPDKYVTFRLETVLEDDFRVAFIDGWEIGRGFSLCGSIISGDDVGSSDSLAFGKRTSVKIGGTPDWFQTSRIGRIQTYAGGGCESFVALPFQIARHVLEEVRHDSKQLVSLGFKRVVGEDGKAEFPIYSLELSKPLD